MWRYLTLFLLLVSTVLSLKYPITNCGSKTGKYNNVKLSCGGSSECILKRKSNITLAVQFTPFEDVKAATSVVHGIIEGLPVPFPLPNPNVCEASGIQCPLKKDKVYNYSAQFFVKPSYPKVRVNVKWEIKDENNEDIICFTVPARIQ